MESSSTFACSNKLRCTSVTSVYSAQQEEAGHHRDEEICCILLTFQEWQSKYKAMLTSADLTRIDAQL